MGVYASCRVSRLFIKRIEIVYYGVNATESNTFLQTLAGPVYTPSYDMPMACRTHNLQAEARRIIITVVVTVVVVAVAIPVVIILLQ